MPVYNTPCDILRQAVESILNQTFKNFEFIIVDDCSKINIKDIIASYNDERITLIRCDENLGIIGALNKGFSLARAKYIARMDSDDISYPKRLEKQFEFMENHEEIDVLGTFFEKFPKAEIIKLPIDDEEIKKTMIFNHNVLCHPSVMLRKSTLNKLNIIYDKNHSTCEDYGLWLKYLNNLKFANLDEVLLKYRWSGKNISKRKTEIQSINSQILMFEAQGKHFGLDYTSALNVVDKFKYNKIVTSKDLIIMNDYILKIKELLSKQYPRCTYSVNRVFYKNFLKKCISDITFIKILFSKELDDIIKLTIFEKIGMILGF